MLRIKLTYVLLFLILSISSSCKKDSMFNVVAESKNSKIDSIFIIESISAETFLKLSLTEKLVKASKEIKNIKVGKIKFTDGKHGHLIVLRPGKKSKIQVIADSTIRTGHVEDSLLTYLWRSNNDFLAKNGNFIFSTSSPDSVITLFNDFRLKRERIIERYSPRLSMEVKDLLQYQNAAKFYSFLFFYGRTIKKLPPHNTFYDFIEQMEADSQWTKTFPYNALHKYEIKYLRKYDSINSIESFLSFIEKQKIDNENKDFLKSTYITELIDAPFNWEWHNGLLDTQILNEVIQKEKTNQYAHLIKKSYDLFFSTQKGKPAYDFTAETVNGKKIKLSDYKGKIVFIDNWASWCGPCIAERPEILKMAERYSENPDVEFLMISLDSKKIDWLNFLNKESVEHLGTDLFIENGMNHEYGKNYNIKFIPKYMLINQNGSIINSNIQELSSLVERLINANLKDYQ